MNETIKTILNRRSCRAFTEQAVAESDVRVILDCALAAASGMGRQTWQFTAVMNREKIQKLCFHGGTSFPVFTSVSAGGGRIIPRGGAVGVYLAGLAPRRATTRL